MSLNSRFKGHRFVGVVTPSAFRNLANPKRLLLMFDALALDLSYHLHAFENTILQKADHEIQYLSNEGLLTTLNGLEAEHGVGGPSFDSSFVEGGYWIGEDLTQQLNTFNRSVLGVGTSSRLAREESGGGKIRYTASHLRLKHGIDAVAIPSENEPFDVDQKAGRETVLRITLDNFPLPSDTTSWENILDFKDSPKRKEQHQRLKVWVNNLATKEMKSFEVQDELDSLMPSYEHELKVREIATNRNTVQILMSVTTDILESLAHFKFKKAREALFSFNEYPLKILEEEKKVPGREIAYIIQANRTFKK